MQRQTTHSAKLPSPGAVRKALVSSSRRRQRPYSQAIMTRPVTCSNMAGKEDEEEEEGEGGESAEEAGGRLAGRSGELVRHLAHRAPRAQPRQRQPRSWLDELECELKGPLMKGHRRPRALSRGGRQARGSTTAPIKGATAASRPWAANWCELLQVRWPRRPSALAARRGSAKVSRRRRASSHQGRCRAEEQRRVRTPVEQPAEPGKAERW